MALAVKKDMLVTLSVRMADMSGKILEESGPEGLTYLHGHVWATPRPWSVVLSSRACPARPMTADAGT